MKWLGGGGFARLGHAVTPLERCRGRRTHEIERYSRQITAGRGAGDGADEGRQDLDAWRHRAEDDDAVLTLKLA